MAEETEDLRDSVLKLFLVEGQSHPFNVVRASELRRCTVASVSRPLPPPGGDGSSVALHVTPIK